MEYDTEFRLNNGKMGIRVDVAMVHEDIDGTKTFYAVDKKGSLYKAANIEACLRPFSGKALYYHVSDDPEYVKRIRFESIEDLLRGE